MSWFTKALAALFSSGIGSSLGFGLGALLHVPPATTTVLVGVAGALLGGIGTYIAPANTPAPLAPVPKGPVL